MISLIATNNLLAALRNSVSTKHKVKAAYETKYFILKSRKNRVKIWKAAAYKVDIVCF